MLQVKINTNNFPREKILEIKAANLFDAFSQIAIKTKTGALSILKHYQDQPDYLLLLTKAKKHFNQILQVRQTHPQLFTTLDGINHLEKYLESFVGYCQGLGVSLEEGALLQMEIETGCQSLTIKNYQTQNVYGFHTEEDSTAYEHFGDACKGKYWVNIKIDRTDIGFLGYAGLCGYGYSTTYINSPTHTIFNTADVLGSIPEGLLWSNLVNFLIMDCADISQIKDLIDKLNQLPHSPKFFGGYTTTPIECRPDPTAIQVEFGGDLITLIEPQELANASFFTGINYPHHQYIRSVDVASENPIPDTYDLAGLRRIYQHRFDRLAQAATYIDSHQGDKQAIKNTLQNPAGEWRHEWHTGFSNCYVANYLIFSISQTGDLEIDLYFRSPGIIPNHENIPSLPKNSN